MVYCKGEIKFITRSERNREPAKFVLVTGENDPRRAAEKVLRIMLDEWKIPKPELVIAVAGGSRRFRVSDEHRQIFIDGLNRLTQATCESWLLTAGTDMGVVNVVGDAMKRVSVKARHKVHCIGIASWHEVDGRENIIDTETEERRLSMSAKGGNDISDDEATETTLLATPGSSPARRESRPFKKESAALAQSQLLLSKTFYSSTYTVLPIKSSGPIPINPFHTHFVFVSRKDKDDEERFRVKLRVELQKLLTTGAAPASGVLIQMEGGIDTTRAVRNALKRRIPVVLCEGTGRAADYLSYACRHCENIDQVEVYDADQLNENAGFDFAVLQALLRARGASREYFYLAFNWNRGDIAKEMMSLNNLALSTGDKEELMSRALSEKENRVTFVRLLLDHGLVLNDYLTNFRLDQLYHWHASKSSLALDVEIRNSCPSYRRSVNEELKSMMRGYYTPSNVEEKYEKRPFRELFIWALLVNRYELASFFWTRCADPISLAIVACRVYKCIASKGFADPDDEALCLTLADEYEDKACNVLAETRALDDDYALQLVERRLPLLGNLNMLELGALADCKRFVGHASCQRSLDNRWDGDMKYPFTHKVLLPVLFPPAIFCTVKFKHEHSCLGKINAFYSAPMTKFVFDWVALLCFLILYSHVSLYMDRYPFKTQDYILHVWVLTMLLEEIRQIFIPRDEHESVWQRFTNYWRSIWNVLDTFAIICVAVGFGIRFYDNDTAFSVSRALYAIGCVIFWIRMLRMYLFSKNLGPFLIMIKGMVSTLTFL
uniref:Transient receptor potential cation channel subfamily M member 3-like n=1 Tax=Saccoglossus kowalevskii TaxID=10224 RepID=A0ABM0MLY2_SACKO|nr:PREDICTED: transient receptor potential cation channel subfamily M member 3-like [Saccoglossus kowalevskii]